MALMALRGQGASPPAGTEKRSISQTRGRKYRMAITMISMEMRFIQKPVFTISDILMYPELNTIALGGVATGSMNAQLAARHEEIINP